MGLVKTIESEQLDERIIYYYKNGWKLKDIASELDLTIPAVKCRLDKIRKKQKIGRRPYSKPTGRHRKFSDEELLKYVDEGLTQRAIAKKLNVHYVTVYLRLKSYRGNNSMRFRRRVGEIYEPKIDCFAYSDGECAVLTKLYCVECDKCTFYKKRSDT